MRNTAVEYGVAPVGETWSEALRSRGLRVEQAADEIGVNARSLLRYSRGRLPERRYHDAIRGFCVRYGIDPACILASDRPPSDNVTDLAEHRAKRGLPAGRTDDTTPPKQEEPLVRITSREFLEPEELAFFGLESDPFDDSDNPEDIWMSPALIGIERAMKQAVQRRQIVALIGDPGSGKSSLIRRFYGQSGRQKQVRLIAPASLDRRRITSAALSVAILRDLTGRETSSWPMESRSELLRATLEEQDQAGNYPVLIIDEAHLLKADALLAIKQLWDSHTLFKRLAVIIVGQLPLESTLRMDVTVRELTGRTRILAIPKLLTGEAVKEYLSWRCARVNAKAEMLFNDRACAALATVGEYPLWINNKAILAMRYAHIAGHHQVTAEHVGRS